MSDTPHLQPSGPGDDDQPDLAEMLRAMMGGGDLSANPQMAEALKSMGIDNLDPATMAMVQAQVQAMMSSPDDGGFNVELATDVARKTVAQDGDPSVTDSTRRDVDQVVQVANLWLDAVTDFTAPTATTKTWSRAEWVALTMPVWRRLVEPVAHGVGGAIKRAMQQQMGQLGDVDLGAELGLPPGIDASALMGQMEPMVARMSSAMFGMQVGQAVGALAGEVVTGTEVGLPLVEGNAIVVLPSNVAAFAEGLGIEAGEVHLYLAVREAARARLFDEVAWLGPSLIAAVQSYAGDISIDTEGIEEALRDADTSDPAAMQEALQGSLFTPTPSEAQQRALTSLETTLALVEGWVDVVSERATTPHLPNVSALSEAVRRRRASGGPAERIFSSLVGLELRPRRLRDAAGLWAALEEAGGAEARDTAWKHPDFAPEGTDLDDPMAYVARRTGSTPAEPVRDEMDDALDQLLAQGHAELDSEQGAGASGTDERSEGPDDGSGDGGSDGDSGDGGSDGDSPDAPR